VTATRRRYWEIIADNLSKTGWSWGCVSAIDSNGRTIWIADAHRGDGKRFIVAISKPTMNATIVFIRQFAEKHCKLASTLSREALPLPCCKEKQPQS
jgi:hypothetical protein